MNTNLRAIVFGTVVAAVTILTLNTVYAAEQPQVVHLDAIEVVAHRNFDATAEVTRLDAINVTAHKSAI